MTPFETAYEKVCGLVNEFKASEEHYLSPKYQESQVRTDYLDKFFTALGWDVRHKFQTNPREQEVSIEVNSDSLSNRKVDYAFFLGPEFKRPVFLVEAKKPSQNLDNADYYFQTVRYGYNISTSISILTDFQELHIIDCRRKPEKSAGIVKYAKIKKYHYTDYLDRDKFGSIYWLFSREAVEKGKLKDFWKSLPKPKGVAKQLKLISDEGIQAPPDNDFLADLDQYREKLAKAFKKTNPELTGEVLTASVQAVLDRLVFIRFLEDKTIEPDFIVDRFLDPGASWQNFLAWSIKLDKKYNGIVFKKHFIDRTEFNPPDDGAFFDICESLSHKESPYLLNYIPVEILGSIYERFLGKVITATAKQVRVEDKPEVRKAGGVYYTPKYIVDYIVENTVGKILDGKNPKEVSKLRFADIACGSGSFLIAVFDQINTYVENWYNNNPSEAKKDGCSRTSGDRWTLSLSQKRDILKNNIFGVDIDAQAVEVAQLSLFLKLLESESISSTETYQTELKLADKTILPDLSKNILCGNSLVEYDVANLFPLSEEDEAQIKPFDFNSSFKQVMDKGGFDVIVGNPPYVRIQTMQETLPVVVSYFKKKYRSAAQGNYDIYVNFVERGFGLLNEKGRFGYIVPNKFFRTDYGEGLRGLLAEQKAVSRILDFGDSQVFNATTYTCLLFLSKVGMEEYEFSQSTADEKVLLALHPELRNNNTLSSNAWAFTNTVSSSILEKVYINSFRLLEIADMSRGSSSGNDNIFMVDSSVDIEPSLLRTPIFATDFGRYQFQPEAKWKIIFPYNPSNSYALLSDSQLKTNFPKAFKYLNNNKQILIQRKQFSKWYSFSAPRNLELHDRAQIIVPLLANRGIFSLIPLDVQGNICPMASGGFSITLNKICQLSPKYLLALLNSKLLFWILQSKSNIFRGGWITCTKQYFGELPIKNLDLTNPSDKRQHDALVKLVEQMLETKKRMATAFMDPALERLESKCAYLDNEIDKLVYGLYELTKEEIKIVEGGG